LLYYDGFSIKQGRVMSKKLTLTTLRNRLEYNELSGIFTWKQRNKGEFETLNAWARWQGQYSGKIAGTKSNGYLVINIDYEINSGHRLAWLYMHGAWPNGNLDHINGNRADNRIENLREATQAQNRQNLRGAKCNNSTGLLGVSKSYKDGKYRAAINGKHLGLFDTKEQAHSAYIDAKRILHLFNVEF
jgi:hypothetical protein